MTATAEPQASGGPMACPVCGTPTVPGARYCFHCGRPLPSSAEVTSEAERRIVTVLFGDLSDFTSWAEDLDPERVGVVTDRVLAALAQAVADFGGTVDKLTGDGIMAVFGAPTSHEDDAQRAVRAAGRMQDEVRRLIADESGGGRRLGLRVGINTGEVLAGVQAGLSYTVIGDTVNTAARLSDAATIGAVYAGREAAIATLDIASWRALTPLRLKGKREPVEAFELVGLRRTPARRIGLGDEVPLIGRESEIGLLIGRLLDVQESGAPSSIALLGEAGVGKTRLADELGRFAGELPGSRVLWGRCTPYGGSRDLGPLVEVVRTACGITDSDEPAEAAAKVERTVSRVLQRRQPATPGAVTGALQGLLGVSDLDSTGPLETVAPGATRAGEPVLDAVASLLDALAYDGPLLVVIDDLQWAGVPLVEALLGVASRLRGPVLVLALGRDIPEALPEWWQQLPRPELMLVTPLEEPATDRLLRAYLAGARLDEQGRRLLLDRAQGNPFFLAELLHLLVDRGALRRSADGDWVLAEDVPTDLLPAGVHAVLAARIDGLPVDAKAVLRDAAVVGVRFRVEPLAALARLDAAAAKDRVRRSLAVLTERGILHHHDDDTYAFAHTLVRDVAYSGLPKAERARRHAAVAQWGAESLRAPRTEVDALVASHGERAAVLAAEMNLGPADPAWRARGPAFNALARLGQAALARDDNVAADDFLARALRLGTEPQFGDPAPDDAVLNVRVGRARILAARHDFPAAEELLRPALAATAPGTRAGALVVLGDIRRRTGDHDGAVGAFVSALAAASEAGLDRISGEALRQLGMLSYFDGRLRLAEEHFGQAYALADRVGDTRGAAWALQHLAWSATTRGAFPLADETLERAADLFLSLEDTGGLSWCAGTEALVRLLQGRLSEARELASGVLPLGEVVGERWGVAVCLTIDAMAAAELGFIDTAQEEAERARDRFAELGDGWGEALACVALGIAARGADEPEAAIEHLQRAAALSTQATYPLIGPLALVAEGYCHLDRKDVAAAERTAREALDGLSRLDLDVHAASAASVLLAQVLRAKGDLETALAMLTELAESADQPTLLFSGRQVLAHYAGTLLQCGRADEALTAARRAVETPAEDVRSRVLSLRALGAALVATGDAAGAEEALREALAVSRSTGQRSEVAASERALAAATR